MKQPSQRKRNPQRKSRQVSLLHPPALTMNLKGKAHLRYQVTSAESNFTVLIADIFDTISMAASTTVGYTLFNAIKLNYVEMWSMSLTGAPNTVSCTYNLDGNSIDSPGICKSDTSLGVAEPAHIKFSPPPKSAASFWQTYSSENLFFITAPTNTIIDICFDYVVNNGPNAASSNQSAMAGATVGTTYGRGLDGLAAGSTKMPMVAGTYPAQ